MKLLNIKVLFPLFIIFFWGCREVDSPKPVAEKFLIYWKEHEYDKAREYVTPPAQALLDMLAKLENQNEKTVIDTTLYEVEVGKCNIRRNKATCKYTVNGEEKELTLVRINNEWLVDEKNLVPNGQ
jgi:hypothetical protein